MPKARLLIVDDEQAFIDLYSRRLERLSYEIFSANSGIEALKLLENHDIDVLITDYQMPGMDGCEIITNGRLIQPLLQSIVITGYSDLKSAIDAMGAGAFNYLQKPIDFTELDVAIKKGLEKRKLIADVQSKQRQLEEYRNHLEELVEKRTLALTEANEKLQREIDERKFLEKSLREAKTLAENASMAKSEFLANMSHEIRTPMTSAIGLLNLVLDTELLPKQKAYLEMARISSVVMHNLLNDILDFSKIEAGRLKLESISFDPAKIIDSVIHLQHLQAEEKSINLSCNIDEHVPQKIIGDPNRLRQILLNLVSNAIKFTQYGEILIECRKKDENNENSNQVILQFSVKDSGVGIDKDKISVIFDAFTQADSSTTRKFGGVGLGLNICSKLVAMMGGKIWAESELEKGSTFHFTCQFDKKRVTGQLGKQSQNNSSEAERFSERTALSILVVEDDQTNQWVIREILEKEGHTVVIASNGIKALEEAAGKPFDLVLLDLKMPEMTGYEVACQLRKIEKEQGDKQTGHIPIMALTGLASEDEKKRCLAAGMDDFLAKPFSIDQLITKTRKYASQKAYQQSTIKENVTFSKPDSSILQKYIFDENEALNNAAGNRQILIQRVNHFLQKAPLTLKLLRSASTIMKNTLMIEQEIQNLKNKALKVGAINFADELFSLLMQLRKKEFQEIDQNQIINLENEFDAFCQNPEIQKLSSHFKE